MDSDIYQTRKGLERHKQRIREAEDLPRESKDSLLAFFDYCFATRLAEIEPIGEIKIGKYWYRYLDDAIQSYSCGFNYASIAMCRAIIELLACKELGLEEGELGNLNDGIEETKWSDEVKKKAHFVREIGNEVLHAKSAKFANRLLEDERVKRVNARREKQLGPQGRESEIAVARSVGTDKKALETVEATMFLLKTLCK